MIQHPLMKTTAFPQNREPDQELIELLENLGNLSSEYPSKLLNARRAAFIV